MANLNLLDIAKMNNSDDVAGLIEESIAAAPELNMIDARTISGTMYKTLVRSSLPSVGFRNANEGVAAVKSAYEIKTVETFIVDAPIEIDKAVADANEDGWESVLALEGNAVLEAAFRSMGSQMYYGTATAVGTSTALAPTKGFPGLIELYDSSNMEVDVTGTGSDTSSAWLVKWGPQYLRWVIGMGGEVQTQDAEATRLTDSAGLAYSGYRKPFELYIGLQMVNPNSVVRIKNIDSSTNTLNDDDVYSALEKFPAGVTPDAIFMSRRSRGQIRSSRTATNATGAVAPTPTEVENVPIVVTDSILDTETAA